MKRSTRRAHQAGFSLLELLVVLTILASMAGLSVAWLDGGARQGFAATAEQLRRDLEQAAIVAVAEQKVVGLRPRGDGQGYDFVTSSDAGAAWQEFEDRRLPAREWPEAMGLQRQPSPPTDDSTPWLLWWPDGEVVGAQLRLVADEHQRTLAIDALGVRHVTEDDDA